jgi:hypothetical protein
MATGWTTEGSEFESQWVQEFSILNVVQTGSGAHPASLGVKLPGCEVDPSSLCRIQENMYLYIHSPIRLHGLVLNQLSTGTILPVTFNVAKAT